MNEVKTAPTLAMLGGGQLGRFFVQAAQNLGYKVTVLDPDPDSPAGKIADQHICKKYDDQEALLSLTKTCQAASTEFENIPAASLKYLEKHITVRPGSHAVSIVQNRILEKSFLRENFFPVGDFAIINLEDDIQSIDPSIFPAILKIAQFGYDGKGQIHVNNIEELKDAFAKFNFSPCVLEKKMNLDTEVSVVLARSVENKKVFYPIIENKHVNGILDTSMVPASIDEVLSKQALTIADKLSTALEYIGVMAVEFFVSNGAIYVNEIAPRPHNSGHFSIDACRHNQFDQQVRALVNLPLADTSIHAKAIMVNLLGDVWIQEGKVINPPFTEITNENTIVHIYGKKEPRPGRKMGHFTVIGKNLTDIKGLVDAARAKLSKR